MALLDRVPGDLNLYIGGLFTLRRKDALKQANITHVLSVLRMPLDEDLFSSFKHMVVEVDDVEDENLLQYFPQTNAFIEEGLKSGGGVLVHCAMGKSRSATCVIAYLMHKHHISPTEALDHVRQARSICEPNEGFMRQLELYHQMRAPEDVEGTPAYQRWAYQREVELSLACNQAPEADKIRFEDEHVQADGGAGSAASTELRCRKCRRMLATTQFLSPHSESSSASSSSSSSSSSSACAHYFLEPLSWMRPELEQGKLDGRLECPKCRANVGKYAWQGMQCSCGQWVVPGLSLAKNRIDEASARPPAGATGIRRPPGAQPPGQGPPSVPVPDGGRGMQNL